MNADSKQAKAIFLEAVEKHDPDQWPAFLDQACAGQPDLRRRVEVLLVAHREAGTAQHQAAPEGPAAVDVNAAAERPGIVIGPYKLLQQIGEGGMGSVFMAEQTRPVQRKVALKLIKSGMDSQQVIARFEAERQALALMDHPNIARVLDAGATASGRPYFVMELVKGVPITKYCDEHHLTPRQRLELFVPVCQAVQHAHQKGIIHRDLKPSNVMVCLYDGKPVPKVIDFGVAKAAGPRLTEKTLFTELGQVVGTLEYMSPEQAEPNQLDIDTRSDIYSLGVLLYELLTGTTPLERKRFQAVAFLEVLRLIREEESPKPSTRLSTAEGLPSIAANRGLEPKKLSGLVRGELDWIVMKTLEKDRNRRYETANGLALDVQRYLNDEPVQACPPSASYRLRKFTRRNKGPVLAGTVIFLLLIGGIVGTTLGLLQAQTSEEHAQDEAIKAGRERDQANRARAAAQTAGEAEKVQRQLAEERAIEATKARDAEREARKAEREARKALDSAREEKEQQRTVTNRDLSDALVAAAGLREKSRTARPGDTEPWGQFRAALQRAEALAGSPLADPALVTRVRAFQAELKQDEADRRMLARLEEIRLSKADQYDSSMTFDYVKFELRPLYEAAFNDYGLPVFDLDVDESARRIAASRIRDWLVAALDHCAGRNTDSNNLKTQQLIRVIQRVEKDKGPWVRAYYDARLRNDHAALLRLAKQPEALQQPPSTLCLLAWRIGLEAPSAVAIARRMGIDAPSGAAIGFLREAQVRHPADLWINHFLAYYLHYDSRGVKKDLIKEAVGFSRVALAARPESPSLRWQLACLLRSAGAVEADAHFRHLTQLPLDPKDANACDQRARCYANLQEWDKAIAASSKAIEVDPKNRGRHLEQRARWYINLKQWDKAIADCDKAIKLMPQNRLALPLRAVCYANLKKWDKAVADYSKYIEFTPRDTFALERRASFYRELRQWDKAIADYSKVLKLTPRNAGAHLNLGVALRDKKDLEAAIRAYQAALKIDPNLAMAHYSLANALRDKKDLKAAVRAYQAALKIDPNYAEAHCNLGWAFAQQGRFRDALVALQTGHKLGSQRPGWPYDSAGWVRQVEQLMALDAKLAKVLNGQSRLANASERLQLALFCQTYKKLYATAVAWYTEAFAAEPRTADDLKAFHRYNAACAAALAGSGQGRDATKLEQNERVRLRNQALDWLRADLALHAKGLQGADPRHRTVVRLQMEYWQRDDDLIGIRDSAALAKLPAGERQAWIQLWTDVETLLRQAQAKRKQ